MSTQYRFIEPVRKARVETFQELLKGEVDQAIAHIKARTEEDGEPDQMAESAIEALDMVSFRVDFTYYDIENVIGTAGWQKFTWRVENGFCSVSDVKRYLDEHPDMVIEDEYGETFTLEEFAQKI